MMRRTAAWLWGKLDVIPNPSKKNGVHLRLGSIANRKEGGRRTSVTPIMGVFYFWLRAIYGIMMF
ncbi:MAG TPA: hypothetical protein VFW47_14205 [Phenylobacterium sp.]|nr:hypothetical protein [Phenylobacterium sp.]